MGQTGEYSPGALDPKRTTQAATKPGMPIIPEVSIQRELGRGGMGVVYLGIQPYLDRQVAVKVLSQEAQRAPGFIERFRREAKILAGLVHPNIVGCYQAGTTKTGECYLVMELIKGPDLTNYVNQHGPLAPLDALGLVIELLAALQYANDFSIIHRDVKPDNLLLAPLSGEHASRVFPYQAKLADLGLAKPTGAGNMHLTATGMVIGTPATMSPEQLNNPESVDFRTDIYGSGCVLYYALTGEHAFKGDNFTELVMQKAARESPDPRRLRPELTPPVAELVQRMLAPFIDDRPGSYKELIEDCEHLRTRLRSSDPMTKRKRLSATQTMRHSGRVEGMVKERAAANRKSAGRPHLIVMGVVALLAIAAIAAVMNLGKGEVPDDGKGGVTDSPVTPTNPKNDEKTALAPDPKGDEKSKGEGKTEDPVEDKAKGVVEGGAEDKAEVEAEDEAEASAPIESLVFGEPKDLFGAEFGQELKGWQVEPEESWGPAEDQDGAIQGQGKGVAFRGIKRLPVAISGKVHPFADIEDLKSGESVRTLTLSEAAILVRLDDGAAIALKLDDLGGRLFVGVRRIDDLKAGSFEAVDGAEELAMETPEEIDFEIAIGLRMIRIKVMDQILGTVRTNSRPVAIGLLVQGESSNSVRVSDLQARLPRGNR